jgi:hypothetical protein
MAAGIGTGMEAEEIVVIVGRVCIMCEVYTEA